MIYFILALLVTACGRGVDSTLAFQVDDAFTKYITAYNVEADARGFARASVTIEFGDMESEGHAAECRIGFIGARKIVVSKFHWGISKDEGRRVQIFHELGHCMLNRGHSEEPHSIMYPSPKWPAAEKVWIDELFYGTRE